jgi:FMN phosphatase YigB (HAD superfamily)
MKTDNLMIRAVLFDVFGTLLDAATDDYLSPYSHVLLPLQLDEAERIRAGRLLYTMPFPTVGHFADRLEELFPGRKVPAASREAAAAELQEDLNRIIPVAGATGLLRELRLAGVKTALISNLASPYEQVIRRHGIDRCVDATVYSFDVGYQKPEREIFDVALNRIDAAATEVLMIGDDPINDGEGARSAGLRARIVKAGSEDGGRSLREVIRSVLANVQGEAIPPTPL